MTLTSIGADGTTRTLQGAADAAGKALFNVAITTQPTEYVARSGDIESNGITVTPLLERR